MIFRRWTTPGELMDKWRCWPFQLAEAWLNGLPVYSSINGVRVDPGSSCLECTSGSINGGKACDDELCSHHWTYAGHCDEDYYRADIGTIGQRIASGAFTFDLDEVEAFEQAHGLRGWTQTDHAAANSGTLAKTPLATGITGAMIEKRWQGRDLDLLTALRSGALTPVDKIVAAGETCGPRRTKEMDPCLYCEDGPVGCECEHLEQDDFCTHWSHDGRMFRVRHAIFLRREVIEYELNKGVNIVDESQGKPLRPTTTTIEPGHNQQVEDLGRNFKTAKEFADHYRSIEGVAVGWIMLEIVDRWGLKNYAAAAVALGDPIPEKGSEAAKSYGERFRYHTGLLDQSE